MFGKAKNRGGYGNLSYSQLILSTKHAVPYVLLKGAACIAFLAADPKSSSVLLEIGYVFLCILKCPGPEIKSDAQAQIIIKLYSNPPLIAKKPLLR
jgi:hypothetical protein